eukprot:COSAG01_NODE_31076_length_604_cov_0.980198_1_plen_86_part_01
MWYSGVPVQSWTYAKVVRVVGSCTTVEVVGGGGQFTSTDASKVVQVCGSFEPQNDMVHLCDPHEAALLHNLRVRFETRHIYTYIGP